ALTLWRKILQGHADFAQDELVQEDSYESQVRYLELAQEARGRRVKPLLILGDYLTHAAMVPPSVPVWMPTPLLTRAAPVPFLGPLDGNDNQGMPLIRPDTQHGWRRGEASGDQQPQPMAAAAPAGPAPEAAEAKPKG